MSSKKVRQDVISPQEFTRMLKKVDLSSFWREVVIDVSREADAYYYARAKSREGAERHVFI